VDPDSLNPDPDDGSGSNISSESGSTVLMTKNLRKKRQLKFAFSFFDQKIA
jgi:hypothetical protein